MRACELLAVALTRDPGAAYDWDMTAPADRTTVDGTPPKTPEREVLDGIPVVTWEDETGCRRAALDRCPHRRAPLSAGTVEDGVLRCPYHGWAFDGSGGCVDIPAVGTEGRIPSRARLTLVEPHRRDAATAAGSPPAGGDAVGGDDPRLRRFRHPVGLATDPAPATVQLLGTRIEVDPARLERSVGLWWYAPEDPIGHLPVVEEDHDDRFVAVHSPPQVWHVEAGAAAENFLDLGHIPWLHRGTFADPDAGPIPRLRVVDDAAGFETTYDHRTLRLHGPGVGRRHMVLRYTAPFSVVMRLAYLDDDATITAGFFLQPVGPGWTRVFAVNWRDDVRDGRTSEQDTIDFQQAVGDEDRWMLELLPRDPHPLDPRADIHTRADATTVALRRVLRRLLAG